MNPSVDSVSKSEQRLHAAINTRYGGAIAGGELDVPYDEAEADYEKAEWKSVDLFFAEVDPPSTVDPENRQPPRLPCSSSGVLTSC